MVAPASLSEFQLHILFAAIAFTMLLPRSACSAAGIWAANGYTLQTPTSKEQQISAPNKSLAFRETTNGLELVGPHATLLTEILSNPSLTEILWSPHSKAFIVNASDGGVVGTWQAFYYSVNSDGLPKPKDLQALIDPLVEGFPDCVSAERVNLGVLGWLEKATKLLVVAEVPPHSSCKNMEEVRGFYVDIASWKVVKEVSGRNLRQVYVNMLGSRLVSHAKSN